MENNIDKIIYLIKLLNINEPIIQKCKQLLNEYYRKNLGSIIAKDGFKEEYFLINILNTDHFLLEQLSKFINLKLEHDARLIKGNKKSDITISNINIQHKKTKNKQFGQIDRHYLIDIINKIPKLKECEIILKKLCEKPIISNTNLCDKNYNIKKINTINYTEDDINIFISILEKNKKDILTYAFLGHEEEYKPNIFSISLYDKNKRLKLIFWKIDDIINYLIHFPVKIKKSKTVIEISNGLTLQRKGGDNGYKQSNHLQIKFIPTLLPLDNALIYEL